MKYILLILIVVEMSSAKKNTLKSFEEMLPKIIEIYKKETEKECYKIEEVKGEEPSILDDKIGGKPYIPKGEKIPLDSEGKPMALLIQINLKKVILNDYPNTGFLTVFSKEELKYPPEYKIKYYKEATNYETDLPENNLRNFVVRKPMKIKLTKVMSHMPLTDYRSIGILTKIINKAFKTNIKDEEEIYGILGNNWRESFYKNLIIPTASLGGYADFTQDDPRDSESYEQECLIKIDSNLNMGDLYIGDAGIIFIFINNQDIKSCRFDKAKMDWDCC